MENRLRQELRKSILTALNFCLPLATTKYKSLLACKLRRNVSKRLTYILKEKLGFIFTSKLNRSLKAAPYSGKSAVVA